MKTKDSLSLLHIPLSYELLSFRPRRRGLSWIILKGREGSCGFEVKGGSVPIGRKGSFPSLGAGKSWASPWVSATPHLHIETQRGDGYGLSGELEQGDLKAEERIS